MLRLRIVHREPGDAFVAADRIVGTARQQHRQVGADAQQFPVGRQRPEGAQQFQPQAAGIRSATQRVVDVGIDFVGIARQPVERRARRFERLVETAETEFVEQRAAAVGADAPGFEPGEQPSRQQSASLRPRRCGQYQRLQAIVVLHREMLREVRTHAVAQQRDGRGAVSLPNPVVDQQSVVDQSLPPAARQMTEPLRVLAVAAVIVNDDGIAAGVGQPCKPLVAPVMFADAVKNLDDAVRFAIGPPVGAMNRVLVGSCYLQHAVTASAVNRPILQDMIDIYYWPTPNGRKVAIMLEECGLAYNVIPVSIGEGDQFAPEFLKISPNNRMPAIVDRDTGLSVFDGGAILIYLAEKAGKLLPQNRKERFEVLQWLFWQASGLGPMAGQLSHFVSYTDEEIPYVLQRYGNEYDRLLAVMEVRLRDREFLAGDYSIADIASFPWVMPYRRLGNDLDKFENLRRWFDTIKSRPAVQKGVDLGADWQRDERRSKAAKAVLFGQNSKTVFAAADGYFESLLASDEKPR